MHLYVQEVWHSLWHSPTNKSFALINKNGTIIQVTLKVWVGYGTENPHLLPFDNCKSMGGLPSAKVRCVRPFLKTPFFNPLLIQSNDSLRQCSDTKIPHSFWSKITNVSLKDPILCIFDQETNLYKNKKIFRNFSPNLWKNAIQ